MQNNKPKLMALVYTNNSFSKKELLTTVPFDITKKNVKVLAINLTKMWNGENHKTFKKEIEEDI